MRHRLVALLLPLFMLLSQQGAVWHEASDFRQDAQTTESKGKGPASDKPCPICLAFAHLGAAAPPSLPMLELADVRQSLVAATPVAAFLALAPTPCSRDPPTRL